MSEFAHSAAEWVRGATPPAELGTPRPNALREIEDSFSPTPVHSLSAEKSYDFYLTSTFRFAWNVDFNHRIGPALEAAGLRAYLPHRDTNQTMGPAEIFREDLAGIRASRAVLAIAENETPNWGAEVGYAYGLGIPVVALCSQTHEIPLILNGMVRLTLRVANLDAIADYLPRLVEALKV